MTVVMNLSTREKQLFTSAPVDAVMAAHGAEQKDGNTWQYRQRYADLVLVGAHVVTCGDWSAFHCDCHSLELD